MQKKVLLIGLHSDVVEYAKWPGLTPEKLERGLAAERDQLAALGFDADWLLVKDAGAGVAALPALEAPATRPSRISRGCAAGRRRCP